MNRYPTRDEVVDYLTAYAEDLPVQCRSRVLRLQHAEGRYRVELGDRVYEADQVVVATGPFQVPRVPDISQGLDAEVVQLHSADYRTPESVPPGPVLVVGGGNTGYQIAEELAASHEVHLSIGSRQVPLPQRVLGRDLFRVLVAIGAMDKTVDSRIGRRMKDRESLIGSSPRKARRRGVRLHGRATGAAGSRVSFADGTAVTAETVIWATGFAVDHSWIDASVFDAGGRVLHERGVTPARGLYFLGMPWQHTRGSALLGWVKDDAEHIAAHVGQLRVALRVPPRCRDRGPARG